MGLEEFLKQAQKDFGKKYKDVNLEAQDADKIKPVSGMVVDNPLLEFILDRRFLAYGRAYLIYGKKGCSKTSLFYDLAKTFQKQGGYVFFLETERAVDLDYAKKQGVDLTKLKIEHPESLEQAFTKIIAYINNLESLDPDGNTPVMICLDSIAGACPEYEQQDDIVIGETKVGEHARISSAFYRRIESLIADEKCVFVALNQQKTKISTGFGGGASFGEEPPEALIGGEAQFFHSTYHWKVYRTKDLVKEDEHGAERKVGSRHKMVCKRNKLGREGTKQTVEFDLWINGGLDWYSPLIRKLGEEYKDLVSKEGGYYKWKVPNCKVLIPKEGDKPEEMVLDTEQKYREAQLGQLIQYSVDAKEAIRKAFGVPDMPEEPLLKEAEKERKERRKRKKKNEEDIKEL